MGIRHSLKSRGIIVVFHPKKFFCNTRKIIIKNLGKMKPVLPELMKKVGSQLDEFSKMDLRKVNNVMAYYERLGEPVKIR